MMELRKTLAGRIALTAIATGILLFLALLLLLLLHELGHWLLARLCRVRIAALTLGFGPQLFTFE